MEEVLRPYLQAHGVAGVKSILITTNKKKNARSGMLAYSQAVTDLELLRKMKLDGEYERHIFTTMFDLYVEKPLNFDPFGHAELSLLAKI
jgi:hypothetical protein